jgi:hypothetical protein
MTMRALGTCRDPDCGQTDLLWEDGYCAEDCRERATGCPVPLCGCGGGCGCALGTATPQPDRDDGP